MIKLVDGTEVYAHEYNIDFDNFILRKVKYITREEDCIKVKRFSNDEKIRIHNDAIEVYFILYRNNETPEPQVA